MNGILDGGPGGIIYYYNLKNSKLEVARELVAVCAGGDGDRKGRLVRYTV